MKEKAWMKKMKNKEIDEHRKRLNETKPVVDANLPRKTLSSRRREMMRHRHYAALEFENKLMLERLARAMQKKTIDNEAPTKKANGRAQTTRAEMKKINDENKLILRRIMNAEPKYDHRKWEEDAKQREKYLANMCEYPPQKLPEYGITQQKWAENTTTVPTSKPRPSSAMRATRRTSQDTVHQPRAMSAKRPSSASWNRTVDLTTTADRRPVSSRLPPSSSTNKRPSTAGMTRTRGIY